MDRLSTGNPVGSKWLEEISKSRSLAALKDSLRRHHSFLNETGLPERLAILGVGAEGRRLVDICTRQGIEVVAIYDNDATKRGIIIGKHRVAPSDAIVSLDRSVPIIIASHRVLGATMSLEAMGFRVAPFALLQALAPEIFRPHMFYDGLMEDIYSNKAQYLELAGKLSDEESVKTLDRVLGYRLTLDAKLLADTVDWDLYGFSGLLQFDGDEVYVDGGAFDGDSVRMFIDNVGGQYSRVLAFEPDPQTFGRLSHNLKELPKVEVFNYGLHRSGGTIGFINDGSRGSIIAADGECSIQVTSIDEVFNGDRASFIKMNIEGAELEALRGSAKTIAAWRPKMALSVYHRPSDLYEIPKLVHELGSDYRLYLRQHDGGIIETVLYACV